MRRAAIIDNTVLVNLIDSGLDDILIKSYTIFSNLFIPETILQEFLNVPEPSVREGGPPFMRHSTASSRRNSLCRSQILQPERRCFKWMDYAAA